MTSMNYQITPIPAANASELRRASGPIYVADAVPGYPCRQCLRDAEVGEEVILVSHDPFTGNSAYRAASPIFLHREACVPHEGDDLPLQLTRRQLSVRSFDEDEMMIGAAVIEGSELATQLSGFFSDTQAAQVHIHNAGRGCWAATAIRS